MPNPSFKPNRRGLDQLQKSLQKELDKRPVRIPVEADPQSPYSAGSVTHNTTVYNGPVATVHGDSAQVAMGNSGDVSQTQSREVAAGYEDLAVVLADVLARLEALDLDDDDREDATTSARTALEEVVKPGGPDRGVVRRGVRQLRIILGTFADGAARSAGTETVEWVSTALEQLGAALPAS